MNILLSLFLLIQTLNSDLLKIITKKNIKMIKETSFDRYPEGYKVDMIKTYLYNKKGSIVEYSIKRQNNSINQIQFYKYDTSGYLIEKFIKDESSYSRGNSYIIYEYDSNHNMIKQAFLDSARNKLKVYHYKNLNNGQIQVRYEEGNSTDSIIYEYNKNKKLTLVDVYEKGLKTRTYRYTYNSNNLLIKEKTIKNDIKTSICHYTYDSNNRLIKEEEITDGVFDIHTLKYNNNNDLIERIRMDEKGEIKFSQKFKYKYDDMNNWILQEEYLLDFSKPSNKTERIIEYFD